MRSEFMRRALDLAKKAELMGEVPVGAVITYEGKIIAEGYNKREMEENSLCHAEIEAINRACRVLGSWRLSGCEIYVTLEPCPMCAGAIISSRIDRVVYGAYDKRGGCFGSTADFTSLDFNHRPKIIGGYMEKECATLLHDFFSKKRG